MLSRPTSQIKTLGALREAGYRPRSIKDEIRDNLRARLAERRRRSSPASSATTAR